MRERRKGARTGALMLTGVLVLLLTGSRGAVTQQSVELSGDVRKGRDTFIQKKCIQCHSVWGKGKRVGPDLTQVGMGRSLMQIAGSFWNHSPRMSQLMKEQKLSRPELTDEDVKNLVTYLYHLNYSHQPGDPTAGMGVFSQKSCIYCHSVRGVGSKTGPRLDSFRTHQSPLKMAQAMWNHGPEMTATMAARGIQRPVFEGNDMADLLAFIRGQRVAESDLPNAAIPGDPGRGSRVFRSKGCTACHSTRVGASKVGPSLVGRHTSVAELAGAMWNHGSAMWVKMEQQHISRPLFSGEEMADLIAYLYFTGYADSQGDRALGRQLFSVRGCASCHSTEGAGTAGPTLSSATVGSSLQLIAAMWNHAPLMEEAIRQKGMDWPLFENDDMKNLVTYLRSLNSRK